MMRIAAASLALSSLAACGPLTDFSDTASIVAPTQNWREVVSENDRTRLADWRRHFVAGLEEARAKGHGDEIASFGALLDPDAARPGGDLPNGEFACRIIKLGSQNGDGLGMVAYPAFKCRVQPEEGVQGFAKLTGSQRPIGLVFPADNLRHVLLGTLQLGDEMRPRLYGRDPQRDVAGWVEKVGEKRWRILFPAPAFESRMDVMELIPV